MRVIPIRTLAMPLAYSCGLRSAVITAIISIGIQESQATPVFPKWLMDSSNLDLVSSLVWLLVIFGALLLFIVLNVQSRKSALKFAQTLDADRANLRAQLDRLETILESDDQQLIIWKESLEEPTILGKLPAHLGIPRKISDFLSYDHWLSPMSSERLSASVEELQQSGTRFRMELETITGKSLDATARTAGGLSIVRLREPIRKQVQDTSHGFSLERLADDAPKLSRILDLVSGPGWIRDGNGKLKWVNNAYVDAVKAINAEEVILGNIEFFDHSVRQKIAEQRSSDGFFKGRLSVNAGGDTSSFDVYETESALGTIGVALAVGNLETKQPDLQRMLEIHTRTLNQLPTAVAIFNAERRLQFYNEAFQNLWELESTFLDGHPEDSELLNELRIQRKLPEQTDFNDWKRKLHGGYNSLVSQEFNWYLPDMRTIRVIANPHPQGGVTYTYENVTEQQNLASRFNAITRVQGETLDQLTEGVSVFGSDGCLRLWNPAFAKIWDCEPKNLKHDLHISELTKLFEGKNERELWENLTVEVTGRTEGRSKINGRVVQSGGYVIDYATVPLADGSILITFVNVTDSVNIERVLREKNDALEQANQLKNTFIQHVSYELRTPLTSIIGFAQLLDKPVAGPMTEKQREYTEHIMASSSALLALVNDILDLATIDAGIMDLELESVDIEKTMNTAIEGIKDRLNDTGIYLRRDIPDQVGTFVADEKRVRQVLYNLISNAVEFSDHGSAIDIMCRRSDGGVQFTVKDNGSGIPNELMPQVFDNFVGQGRDGKRRGVGLGLPIVKKFVELHGGSVEIESEIGKGTSVTVWFPLEASVETQQAAE